MDLLRAGIHDAVSDALATAYTETLVSEAPGQDAFNAKFASRLLSEKLSGGDFLTATGSSTKPYKYDAARLQSYLADANAANGVTGTATVKSVAADGGELTENVSYEAGKSFTLKGVQVTYVENGYESVVTSDIVIAFPAYSSAAALPYELGKYSIVANTRLDSGLNATISGSVYAGAVNCTAGSLTFQNGDLFSKGDVTLSGNANLSFTGKAAGSELWAGGLKNSGSGELIVGDKSDAENKIHTKNKVYVQNDLTLGGQGSAAVLSGSYTGFGSANAAAANTAERERLSSSILVNGRDASLDLSGLTSLQLAGVSYISGDTPIPMGQSVALKSDQLAYLIPASCLGPSFPTNPYIYTVEPSKEAPVPTPLTNVALWPNSKTAALNKNTLAAYLGAQIGNTLNFAKGHIAVRYKSIDSQNTAACVFIVFNNQADANKYFRDFFSSDPQTARQYFSNYLKNYNLNAKADIKTAGNVYTGQHVSSPASDNYENVNLKTASSVFAASAQNTYAAYAANSPYTKFLKDTIGGNAMKFYQNGKLVAVVSGGDLDTKDYASSKDAPLLLVSRGTVIVSTGSPLFGSVYANTITASANITAEKLANDLASAKNDADEPLSKYLAVGEAGTASTENSWNIGELVTYQNWKKG